MLNQQHCWWWSYCCWCYLCDVDIAENNIDDAQVDGVDADVHDADGVDADVHDADADDADDTGTGCYPGIRRAHRRPATSQLASFLWFFFGDFYY